MDKKSILIADDHPIFRSGLRTVIESDPSFVVAAEASDGEEAVSLAKTKCPDLVLLDMLLPKMSGPDVLKNLQADPATSKIPIVVLSSLPQNNQQKLQREGAVAYFEKSRLDFSHNSQGLVQAINEILIQK